MADQDIGVFFSETHTITGGQPVGMAAGEAIGPYGEIKRRYDDRRAELRDLAEERENEALEAAFAILLNPETED